MLIWIEFSELLPIVVNTAIALTWAFGQRLYLCNPRLKANPQLNSSTYAKCQTPWQGTFWHFVFNCLHGLRSQFVINCLCTQWTTLEGTRYFNALIMRFYGNGQGWWPLGQSRRVMSVFWVVVVSGDFGCTLRPQIFDGHNTVSLHRIWSSRAAGTNPAK